MKFQVKLTRNASLELESIYLWLKQTNPDYAEQWFKGLMNTIATLQDKPRRFWKKMITLIVDMGIIILITEFNQA